MTALTLDVANAIVSATLAKGAELDLQPLCVAIVDGGAHLLALQRQENASILRPQIAHAKAAGALALGMSSRKIAAVAVERPTFVTSLSAMAPFGVVPAAGGVLIVDDHGTTIGAVGVTGDTSDNDETCALAGIAALGLSTGA